MSEQFNLNNRYQFMGQIGKGRFGDVYRAADNFFRREVALKMVHKETGNQEFLQYFSSRYAQQVAMIGKLNHPSIIKTYDFTSLNGAPAWTMDLYSGTSYAQYSGTKLPVEQAANLLIPVAEALAYAHQYGIIHGNLKPSNILLDSNQNPVLTDFGQTQWLGDNRYGYGQFEASAGIGSPEYLAPEQARGGMADVRTDVYSLGIIFYEMITGRRPFSAMTPMETMAHQVSDPLPSPRYFVPNLSQQAEQFLYQATAKDPAQRIGSMSEAAMMLRGISSPSSTGTYYPPASYFNTPAVSEDDDDDDDETIGNKLKSAFSIFRTNKNAKWIAVFLGLLIIAAVVLGIVFNNNKKIESMNAAATQEAISIAETQEAVMAMIEGQRQQTQEAEKMIAAQTQEALDAAATAAAAAAAVPTAAPAQIPTAAVIPTAVSVATGRYQSQTPADGSNFIMGEAFTVTWYMENTGSTNWSYNFKLVFDGGTNFTVGAITEKITEQEIWPGGAAGISLACVAPLAPGNYTMNWHVEDTNGNKITNSNLSITINSVWGELTPTPGPTSESYMSPTSTSDIYFGG